MAEKYSAKMTEAEKTARRNQRMEELKTARAAKFTTTAQTRATTQAPVVQEFQNNIPGYESKYGKGAPTYNAYDITVRPQPLIPFDDNFIYFYSWIGGATTGMWKLYRADKSQENIRKYGSRVFGGKTQATYGTSSFGANSLVKQPKPIFDASGNVIDWELGNAKLTTLPDVRKTGTITNVPGMSDYADTSTQTKESLDTLGFKESVSDLPPGTIPFTNQGAFDAFFGLPEGSTFGGLMPVTSSSTGNKVDTKLAAREAAFDILYQQMADLGLEALVEPLRGLLLEDVAPSEFAVRLRETDAFKTRFSANAQRFKNGLKVLQPGEYINMEDEYRQILRQYGLTQFDNDTYVNQFIANDIAPTELTRRANAAVNRVKNADPALMDMIKSYYPEITQTDMVAYLLDPKNVEADIMRKITTSEIGLAAMKQGISAGRDVAAQLAAQGVTAAEAQAGYQDIAYALPTAEKLSDIYGTTMDRYGLAEAEQEKFNKLASAQRKRERLGKREIAEFGGATGLTRAALGTELRGQI